MARIAALVVLSLALCSAHAPAQRATVPTKGTGQIIYTSQTFDPATGLLHVTGDVTQFGSLVGIVTGTDSYVINPLTGTLSGSGTRTTPDGSSYTVTYVGQFISADETVGTYTLHSGTGRFEGWTGSGTWSSKRWANQLGADTSNQGTANLGN